MQHTRPGFEYCLARGDPEVLVLPLLRRVYRRAGGSAGGRGFGSGEREARRGGVGSDPDASLVALCVLLMLSEEPSLARRIHAAPARDAPWYRERQLRDTTVGSLAVADAGARGEGVVAHDVARRRVRVHHRALHARQPRARV